MKKIKKDIIREKTEGIAEILQISWLLKRKPNTLSGGQQQRVAIARALVKNPAVLLLDEPFSNLDTRLSLELQEELLNIQKGAGVTTLYVTHNQEEALFVSDNIIILKNGVCQQNSSPEEIYKKPQNFYVANFIGKVPINTIQGRIKNKIFYSRNDTIKFDLPCYFTLDNAEDVLLCFRPEEINITDMKEKDFMGEVVSCLFYGKDVIIKVKVISFFFHVYHKQLVEVNETAIGLSINKKAIKLFDEKTGNSIL
jgi:ABC-type sugar transport system ATPase subunit